MSEYVADPCPQCPTPLLTPGSFQSNPYSTARQAHYVQRSSLLTSFPPSLPRDGHPQTSCPRPGVPLLLTNALPSPLGTPLSTVSSYGPFPRSQPQSPGPSPMAATTMSSRATLSYAAPYDPREWVGGSRRTSMIEHHGNEAEGTQVHRLSNLSP